MASTDVSVKVEVMDSHTIQSALTIIKHGSWSMAFGGVLLGMGLMDGASLLGISSNWVQLPIVGIIFYRALVTGPRFKKQLAADDAAHELRTETED